MFSSTAAVAADSPEEGEVNEVEEEEEEAPQHAPTVSSPPPLLPRMEVSSSLSRAASGGITFFALKNEPNQAKI